MDKEFKSFLLEITGASDCEETEVIQSLWSGYGQISRFSLVGSRHTSVVVKCISVEPIERHPKGWNTDRSHERKVKSYEVESNWYQEWSYDCPAAAKVPKLIGVFQQGTSRWIVLEDLKNGFPIRKSKVNRNDILNCRYWLANFHAKFLNRAPKNLWSIGTYWHLDTRPDEWSLIENEELKQKASKIDQVLKDCTFQTIVHGDAKLANFCFDEKGNSVAAVDFQYVGGGCGMKDVAYFLGSCLSEDELKENGEELLDEYFRMLKKAVRTYHFDVNCEELEGEWRRLYRYAVADFTRFLMGWMPTHQKINGYTAEVLKGVLEELGE